MRHFKLAIIVTAITLPAVIIVGSAVALYVSSHGGISNERAAMLGQGFGILFGIIIAPFWIFGAGEMGKERRAALLKPKTKSKTTKPRSKTKD